MRAPTLTAASFCCWPVSAETGAAAADGRSFEDLLLVLPLPFNWSLLVLIWEAEAADRLLGKMAWQPKQARCLDRLDRCHETSVQFWRGKRWW